MGVRAGHGRRILVIVLLAVGSVVLGWPTTTTAGATCVAVTLQPDPNPPPHYLADGRPDVAYSQTITASGGSGTGEFYWQEGGTLPPGLVFDDPDFGQGDSTLTITGTPTVASAGGDYSFSVTASDSPGGVTDHGCSANGAYRIRIPSANLVVTQSHEPEPVKVNGLLRLTTDLVNHGPTGASNVTLEQSYSHELDIESAVWRLLGHVDGTPCAIAELAVTCEVGDLTSGSHDDLNEGTLTVKVRPPGRGIETAIATASSPAYDPVPANNTSEMPFTVVPNIADLDVALVVPDGPFLTGDIVGLKLGVQNIGPDAAEPVRVDVDFPRRFERIRSIDTDRCKEVRGFQPHQVECRWPKIAPGKTEKARVYVRAMADQPEPFRVDARARVKPIASSPAYDDPVAENDSDKGSFVVKPIADVGIHVSAPFGAEVDKNIDSGIELSNKGPDPAKVTVIVLVSDGGTIKSVAVPKVECTQQDRSSWRCTGELGGDSNEIGQLVARWPHPGEARVRGQIRTTAIDRVASNDSDAEPVLVTRR